MPRPATHGRSSRTCGYSTFLDGLPSGMGACAPALRAGHHLRVSDQRERELFRRWQETRDDADGAAWLAERRRMGALTPDALDVLARCAFLPAQHLHEDCPDSGDPEDIIPGAARWAFEAWLALVRRRVLPVHPPEEADAMAAAIRGVERLSAGDDSGTTAIRATLERLSPYPRAAAELAIEMAAGPVEERISRLAYRFPVASKDGRVMRWTLTQPLSDVLEVVHEALVRGFLGVALPDELSRLRPYLRTGLVFVRTTEAPPDLLPLVVRWLSRLPLPSRPRPLLVRALTRTLHPPPGGRSRLWGALYDLARVDVRPGELLALVTTRPHPTGLLIDEAVSPGLVTIHLDPKTPTTIPPAALVTHLALVRFLEERCRISGGELGHGGTRGCAFDGTSDLGSVEARIRTGRVCRDCVAALRSVVGEPLVAAGLQVLDACGRVARARARG